MRNGNNTLKKHSTSGVAIVSVLFLAALMAAILGAYILLTINNSRTTGGSNSSTQGFYAAEGGLNMRAEIIRSTFVGYNRPQGTSPSINKPCLNSNQGTGDFSCIKYNLSGKDVVTYITELNNGAPSSGVVATGKYAGLSYQQYTYRVSSESYTPTGIRNATLGMEFQSRLVPLFQFAVFYQKDLEFQPGADMTLNGRVYTNANLYLNANTNLRINGITSAGANVFRSGKDGRGCSGNVTVYSNTIACSGGNTALSADQLKAYNNQLLSNQGALTVPSMSSLSPSPANELFSKASMRIVAKVNTSNSTISSYEVRNGNNIIDNNATQALRNCNVVGSTKSYDNRENTTKPFTMLTADVKGILNCIKSNETNSNFKNSDGKTLTVKDPTNGGLVIHFSFDDGNIYTNDPNNNLCSTDNSANLAGACKRLYGVKIYNGADLSSGSGDYVQGLSIVTNQPVYLMGNFNSGANKRPAAVMADAINILSKNYVDRVTKDSYNTADSTFVNAAFLSGMDDTVPNGAYNGGLQNYPRLHEDWGGKTLNYTGSFVSLGNSRHVNGAQSNAKYGIPVRNFNYDADFNDASKLPPLTPRLVYLRQLLFDRTY